MATESQLRNAGLRETWIAGTSANTDAYIRDQIATVNKALQGRAISSYTPKELTKMLKGLTDLLGKNTVEYMAKTSDEVVSLALLDAETESALIGNQTGQVAITPTDARIIASVKDVTLTDYATGKKTTSRQMYRTLSKANADQISTVVRKGYADGIPTDEIVNQIVGTRVRPLGGKPYYSGGLLNTVHKRDTNAVVRTVTNRMSATARAETWKANSNVITKFEFVATLDNRTTMVCASLDGTVWDPNDPNMPQPPLHYGCRSLLAPVIDGDVMQGETRVAKKGNLNGTKVTSDKVWQKKKRTERTEVPAGTNYNDFLRGNYSGGRPQPDYFLNDFFQSPERAQIWKDNQNLSVSDMMNGAKPMSIDELRERYNK